MPAPHETGISVAIIGCGKLGTAVAKGLLASQESGQIKNYHISRLIFCVHNLTKNPLIDELLGEYAALDHTKITETSVTDNRQGAQKCDVLILTCPPSQAYKVLSAPGMQEALAGKLMVSMVGGVSVSELYAAVHENPSANLQPCHIIQAIASVAAAKGKSLTVVGEHTPDIPGHGMRMVRHILQQIGDVIKVQDEQHMPAAVAMCASGIAFFARFLEATVDGALALGITRQDATRMAAYTMAGAADLVLAGADPAAVRERVTTPGGSTARGLAVMEDTDISRIMIQTLEATASAHQ